MSRKPFIAGNWKMNKNPEEAKAFVEAVAATFFRFGRSWYRCSST